MASRMQAWYWARQLSAQSMRPCMRTLSPLRLSRARHEKRRARAGRGGSGVAARAWRLGRGGQAYYEPQELRMTQYLMPEGDSPQPTTSTSWSMSSAVLGVLLGSMYTPSFSAILELNE